MPASRHRAADRQAGTTRPSAAFVRAAFVRAALRGWTVVFLVGLLLTGWMALPQPVPGGTALAAAPASYHVVRPGQTVNAIAHLHHLSTRDVIAFNGLRRPYVIYPDQVLRLDRPTVRLRPFATWVEAVTPGMINWKPKRGCPVPPEDLRRIWVSYLDFNGRRHNGSIIMHRALVVATQNVFHTLYLRRFRIQAMAPMQVNMPGETNLGMVTTGYNCRLVGGTTYWSQHSYGNALDINPIQNPMIRGGAVSPAGATSYVPRGSYRRGMMHVGGAVDVLIANGFFWGGRWSSLKDYMHFSTNNR